MKLAGMVEDFLVGRGDIFGKNCRFLSSMLPANRWEHGTDLSPSISRKPEYPIDWDLARPPALRSQVCPPRCTDFEATASTVGCY